MDIFLRVKNMFMTSSSLQKSTKGGSMYVSHKYIDVDSYIIPKKKPDGVEDWMQLQPSKSNGRNSYANNRRKSKGVCL